MGAALHEKYGVKADMKNFAVCVRVDVVKKKKGKKENPIRNRVWRARRY